MDPVGHRQRQIEDAQCTFRPASARRAADRGRAAVGRHGSSSVVSERRGSVADVQARYVVARNGEALDYRFAHVDRLENDGAGTDIGRVYFGEDAAKVDQYMAVDSSDRKAEVVMSKC